MATRKQMEAEAAKHGATIDWPPSGMNFNVDAPVGYVWASTGTHHVCHPFANEGGQSWKPEAYADAIRDMSMGVEPCEDADCDICNPDDLSPAA